MPREGSVVRDAKTVDVSKLIDDQPVRLFHVLLVLTLFLFQISDGYDVQVMGIAGPGVAPNLHMSKVMLGPVLSASVFGLVFGAPLFGWIGDRYGRRPSLLIGLTLFGVLSLATSLAQNQQQLLLLRFLTGLGLGGVPVNSVALVAEYAPKRVRAAMIVTAQLGLTFGSMLPAVVYGLFEGVHGWRLLFIVGGIVPLLIALLGVFLLPESLKFMVARQWPADKIRRTAGAIDPQLKSEDELILVMPASGPARRFQFKQLFEGALGRITPLIWLIYISFLAANYFLHSWAPTVLLDEGLTKSQMSLAMVMFDVGGVVGALTASRLVDRFGIKTVVALYILACPAAAVIGDIGPSVALLTTAIFIAGFCLVGITLSMSAICGGTYPTEIRANGVGWAYGIGRLASVVGPVLGGWLIAMKLPNSELFLIPAAPLAMGAVACFMLMRVLRPQAAPVLADAP
jgi:AAHS family 4-hydroxybenzoate transporter-like MFS transporter